MSITGTSGVIYGIRLLKILKGLDIEIHMIGGWGWRLSQDTMSTFAELQELSDCRISQGPKSMGGLCPARFETSSYSLKLSEWGWYRMNIIRTEWCDATINPVVGCPHGCSYCYAKKQAKRQKQRCGHCYQFIPHPHLERLDELKPTQKPKKIFIDSMWDWNANGVKRKWIFKIIEKIRQCPQHTFQILSKRPARYSRFLYPENVWLGTSIATNGDLHRIHELVHASPHNLKFASVEPIHERIDHNFSGIDWIIVGAETGNRKGRIIPEKKWITEIIETARATNTPVFIKQNLQWYKRVRQFPIRWAPMLFLQTTALLLFFMIACFPCRGL